MKRTSITILGLAALFTVTVSGCGSSQSASSAFSKGNDAGIIAETAAAAAMDTMDMTAAAPAASYEGAKAEEGILTASAAIQPISTTRKLIRNVDLSVETTDFDQLVSDISQNVISAGGYMEQSDISGSSISGANGRRYANFTARVPSDKLDSFITQVGQQANIINKSEYTQDVTLQYSDVESRKKSLTIEQERLWDLLEKADTLESVIALEERLSEIRYQLESFESQLRTYDNQVDYSTIYIYVNEVPVLTPTTPDSFGTRIQKGFSRNLRLVSTTAVNFFVWFLSSLPALVVLAVIAFVFVFTAKKLRPLFKHRSHADSKKKDA